MSFEQWNEKARSEELALLNGALTLSPIVKTLSRRVTIHNSVLVQRFARFNAQTLLDMEIRQHAHTLRGMITVPCRHEKTAPGNEAYQ